MGDGQTPPMARPRVAAGALIRNDAGLVLLVKPTYKDGWDLPGGYVEPNESPADACTRELTEELGLQREPGRLLIVDWAPHPAEGDKLLFIFDGGTLSGVDDVAPDGDEIGQARFYPRDEIDGLTPDRLGRRIHAALDMLEAGDDAYAENGTRRAAAANGSTQRAS